ncbi:30S ribosomal protein S15 [Candidatus Micrarchaeota archaeon]|nr:30S ribosomal protein S15 [Candidatus Micrarchaeota archaeon]
MARLHSKKKGKSGTKRPKSNDNPEWVTLKKEEAQEIVLKLAREGAPAAKIGLILRDQHGVPNARALLGTTLVAFLRKEKAYQEYPEDLLNLIKKAVRMNGHLKNTKNDTHNNVKLGHVESKIQRLVKYYVDKGRLPAGWKYERDKAALLVK